MGISGPGEVPPGACPPDVCQCAREGHLKESALRPGSRNRVRKKQRPRAGSPWLFSPGHSLGRSSWTPPSCASQGPGVLPSLLAYFLALCPERCPPPPGTASSPVSTLCLAPGTYMRSIRETVSKGANTRTVFVYTRLSPPNVLRPKRGAEKEANVIQWGVLSTLPWTWKVLRGLSGDFPERWLSKSPRSRSGAYMWHRVFLNGVDFVTKQHVRVASARPGVQ